MKEMNLEETLEFKRHVRMYLYDLGEGTVNDNAPLLRAADHHFERIMELSGYENAHELSEILNPFVCEPNGRPVVYKYYFDKMREKGMHLINDEEIKKALEEKKKKNRRENGKKVHITSV